MEKGSDLIDALSFVNMPYLSIQITSNLRLRTWHCTAHIVYLDVPVVGRAGAAHVVRPVAGSLADSLPALLRC